MSAPFCAVVVLVLLLPPHPSHTDAQSPATHCAVFTSLTSSQKAMLHDADIINACKIRFDACKLHRENAAESWPTTYTDQHHCARIGMLDR